jgi:radical SAM superfamily enzyme YgiQ (UPF0313 family)
MKVLLISTYELGHQPFGLASPAAWLQAAGASVACLDLSVQVIDTKLVREAELIAFYLPMHTATRLAVKVLGKIKAENPRAHVCCYGLYASMNAAYLQSLGAETILGGEFEEGLVALATQLTNQNAPAKLTQSNGSISLGKQQFLVPERTGLPPLENYARVVFGTEHRTVGYTEASRGCKHLCRHCPIVPIYQGQFRIVQPEIVLADIRGQVDAGARHITFGDPDFFNGVGHALRIVQGLHREYPYLSYDVTIKIEHLLRHARQLRILKETGCLFVTSAVESVDDEVLELLGKGHTLADFIRAVELCRENQLALSPTFVTFTPWTTWNSYRDLLSLLVDLDLVDHVAPIQLAIRLLVFAGSKLLELPAVRRQLQAFDESALSYRWSHADPSLDALCSRIRLYVKTAEANQQARRETFAAIWQMVHEEPSPSDERFLQMSPAPCRASIPYLNEPWYC